MLTHETGKTGGSGALLATYAQFPVRPVRGRGSWLIEADGTEWLDVYGGHAVASTGHSHPHVVAAIAEQAGELLFYSTAVPHPNRERLAEELARRCPDPLDRVFFCNSGAEANENALTVARKVTGRSQIVSVGGGWHGRTVATLAVTDGDKYRNGARIAGMPLSTVVPFGDIKALEAAIDESIAAVIVEPVQGLGGARAMSADYLSAAREATTFRGAQLIFDEIQCGVGRCGGFTAAQSVGVTPDLLTMAKGLASGLPIGAVVMTSHVANGLKPGDLGSTFGGGPVPCAAALATLEVIDREELVANAREIGQFIIDGVHALGVKQVEGRGLLLGLHLQKPAAEVQKALFKKRVLTGTANEPDILRLMPPLSFSRAEATLLLGALSEVLR